MATTFATSTRMVMGYDNWLVKSRMTGVTLVNMTAAAGSSSEHLLYEDPWLTFRSSTPTGNPEIIFQCNTAYTGEHTLVGFVNQNFWSTYERATVYIGNNPAGPWTNAGEVDLAGSAAEIVSDDNPDLLFKMIASGAQTCLRVVLSKASAWPAFEIGNIVLLHAYTVTGNPTVNQFNAQLERGIPLVESVGGALHVGRGYFHRRSIHNYQWTRVDEFQAQKLFDIYSVYGDRLVGIIPPQQTGKVLPWGGFRHHFGRITRCHIMPQQGLTATSHKADVQLQMINGW